MLAAIGIILISKQVPILIGYNKPDFWRNELFNIFTFNHGFKNINNLYNSISSGPILIALAVLAISTVWQKTVSKKFKFLPPAFIIVVTRIPAGLSFTQLDSFSGITHGSIRFSTSQNSR
jgi:MFS superfamily sulfate permease-like transporter